MEAIPRSQSLISILGLVATLLALLYQPIGTRLTVLGFWRNTDQLEHIHGLERLRSVPNTAFCEDLHHHLPSNQLFAACQDDEQQRLTWFPPLAHFDFKRLNTGSLAVVDPLTFTSKNLKLHGFRGPFITHGIDIVSSSEDPETLFILAVNHLPHPDYVKLNPSGAQNSTFAEKARSQIEIFRHKLGSDEANFVRSVRHSLIRTPNDIYAVAPDAFYVTNDHYYREGNLRLAEDALPPVVAGWTDTVHVKITDFEAESPTTGVAVMQALKSMHNNNGLAHGSRSKPEEVLIADTSGGVMHRAKRSTGADPSLSLIDNFQFQSCIDNPSYYEDQYATKTHNASGYVIPGLGRAMDLVDNFPNPDKPLPAMVWHLKPGNVHNTTTGGWDHNLIFQDPGYDFRGASAAVLVGIDPTLNNGKKQGWLFVTGFATKSIVASKVDL